MKRSEAGVLSRTMAGDLTRATRRVHLAFVSSPLIFVLLWGVANIISNYYLLAAPVTTFTWTCIIQIMSYDFADADNTIS